MYNDVTLYISQVELFSTGDVIRVIDDLAKVHGLQENHGGWVDDMALVGPGNSIMLSFVVNIVTLYHFLVSLLVKLVVWSGSSPLEMSEW